MEQTLLFTALAIFPLGQIIRIGIIQPMDFIVGLGAIYAIYKKLKKPDYFIYVDRFLFFAIISWIFSAFLFKDIRIFYGLLYLVRLCSYFYFSISISHFTKNKINKNILLNSLVTLSLVSAIFGWIQLLTIPDIKPFFTYGWDEHLYRLVGTFLDPTYLGLIITFGMIISFVKKKYLIFFVLLISLLFTYSRASYISIFIALSYLTYQTSKFKKVFLIFLAFIAIAFMLPTTKNHSIEITRKFSAIAKVGNYQRSIEIFKKSPIFGIGYNNLCFVKNKYFEVESYSSHACSGLDSSILFILATTGIVGLVSFVELIGYLTKISGKLFRASLLAVLVHSLFANSFFYPWVLIYLLMVLSIDLRTKTNVK